MVMRLLHSNTTFSNNTADHVGRAIGSTNNSYISFEGNSTTVFINNGGIYGGGIHSYFHSNIPFKEQYSVIIKVQMVKI